MKLIPLLLFLILATLIGIAFMLKLILVELRMQSDFSVEDASVKAMTAAVASATSELPPNQGE